MLTALLTALGAAADAEATTYYACVKKGSGAIRLVPRGRRCKRGERKVSLGSTGAPGRNGTNGTNGTNGANGADGKNGTTGFTSTLPSGKTEVGTWGAVVPKAGGAVYAPISFNIPLAAAPAAFELHDPGASPTPECPGTFASPKAAPGVLCVYVANTVGEPTFFVFDPATADKKTLPGPDGIIIGLTSESESAAFGTWAVTG